MGYILDLRKHVGSRPLIMAGACVLVFNAERQLLLQKRSDSYDWGTIGGALELGDSFEEAAHRELMEEAGLSAESLRFVALLSGKDTYYRYPNGDEVYNATAVYEAVNVQGEPRVNDHEGLDLRYFSLEEPVDGLNPYSEIILRKAGYIQKW